MKRLMQYLRPYLLAICLQFTIKFTGTIMDLLLPWLLSYIIDEVIPLNNIRKVYYFGGLMIACAIAALFLNIIANRMAIKTSRAVTRKLRHDLFEKTLYLSGRQTDGFSLPSLISRLTSDTYNVHHLVDRMQRLGVRAPILLLGGIAITLTLEPVLTLILIVILPLLALIVTYISRRGVALYTETQSALDKLIRKIQESMNGMRVIKALSKTEYEKERFDEINSEVAQKEKKAGTLMALTNPLMNLLLNTGLTFVIVTGAYRVNAGYSQPGRIIAFLTYFAIILNALMMVTRLFVMYSRGAASAKRIEEVLDAPMEMRVRDFDASGGMEATGEANPGESPVSDNRDAEESDGEEAYHTKIKDDKEAVEEADHIEFRNVNFSYNKIKNNLTNISFTLKRGETLGIIGGTGSGKSTFLNLLLRFYDIDSGQILIDGIDIKNIPDRILHTKFGVVFQNDFLFADTIGEIINFKRFLDEAELAKAVESAQAGFIYEKEEGLQHRLTVKGMNLSGGQKQRLLIARALAADPEILLLDDSSSALDYITDAKLRRALRRDYRKTTAIIIAQRVSSIMDAERILMLDEGEIIGYGSHEELLASCDSYREIFETQMGDMESAG